MSDAFEEIIAVISTIIFALPLPVTAAQILWINLISDGFPNLALSIDPQSVSTMKQKPRSPKEDVVANWMKELILLVSFVGGMIAFILFYLSFKLTGDVVLSRTIAFATLGMNSLVYVFSIRTLTEPFWRANPFENKWLNIAVLVGFVLQFVPIFVAPIREFFGFSVLQISHVILVILSSFIMFIIIEVAKLLLSKKMIDST
jgi:Ca2+-transporting ATPase